MPTAWKPAGGRDFTRGSSYPCPVYAGSAAGIVRTFCGFPTVLCPFDVSRRGGNWSARILGCADHLGGKHKERAIPGAWRASPLVRRPFGYFRLSGKIVKQFSL